MRGGDARVDGDWAATRQFMACWFFAIKKTTTGAMERTRIVIGAKSQGLRARLTEWWAYRDLFRFLIWREVRIRYAQSALGVSWAIIQPLFTALLLMVVFGYLAGFPSPGKSKFLFYFAAMVPWTFFASAMTDGTASLVNNAAMIGKVYFPRVGLPLAATFARLVDFAVASAVLVAMALFEGVWAEADWWVAPLLVVLMVAASAAVALWLTALAIQYRDVKYAIPFVVQLLMYASPVVYSAARIPARWTVGGTDVNPRLIYGLNPMAGVVEGFRAMLNDQLPMPWDLIAVGAVSASVLLTTGVLFFLHKERIFADVA